MLVFPYKLSYGQKQPYVLGLANDKIQKANESYKKDTKLEIKKRTMESSWILISPNYIGPASLDFGSII